MGYTIKGHQNCTICHPDLVKKNRKGKKKLPIKDRKKLTHSSTGRASD